MTTSFSGCLNRLLRSVRAMMRPRTAIEVLLPGDSTYDSLYIILNTQDERERDVLTERWRDHKLEELNFIGIVGALLAGCLTSTGDWPTILQNGRQQPWTVTTCWYAGIVCALFSVLTIAQQSMRLHRLSGHPHGLKRMRACMSHPHPNSKGYYEPRLSRVYAWQIGPALLVASVLCMVVGMAIKLWEGTRQGPSTTGDGDAGWWQPTSKVGSLAYSLSNRRIQS